MKRTDKAAPSLINPAAFTFVGGCYFGNPGEALDSMLGDWSAERAPDCYVWESKRADVRKAYNLDQKGRFYTRGTCDHCGANFDWGSIYIHTDGTHIVVGNVCALKTLDVPDRLTLDANRLKSRIAAEKERLAKIATARAQALAGGYEWLYDSRPHINRILEDIASKGLSFGGLTIRQVELVKRIHNGTKAEWEVARDVKAAARAAEEAAAQPVPVTDERIKVVGEVLTTKQQDGYMPGTFVTKCLVKTVDGWKVWGSLPAHVSGERGTRLEFMAKVQRSDKDDKFGFFSRPTKVKVLEAVAA